MTHHDTQHMTAAEIAADLDRERAAFADRIDGLRDRLSLDAVMDDVIGYAKANIGPYARVLDGAVRANPLAAVLAAVGVAWLVLGRKGAGALPTEAPLAGTKFEAFSRWEDEGGPPAPLPEPDETWSDEVDHLRHLALSALDRIDAAARQRLRPAADIAADRATVVADLAASTRKAMMRGLESLGSEAQSRILAAREAAYAARLAAVRQGARFIEDRPLTAGAIGLAIGAAVASALPQTDTEDRVFGQDRDRLMQRAKEVLRHEQARLGHTASRLAENVATNVKVSAQQMVGEAL